MKWLIILLIISAGCLAYLYIWQRKKRKRNPFDGKTKLPYQSRKIMTETEMQVYAILLESLPEYMIFPQVQVSRIIETPHNKDNYYWFNFISRLSYDFVICRIDGTPLVALEIDDRTHEQAERQEADNRKNKATEAAGIAIIRWQVGATPSHKHIAKLIAQIDSNCTA